MPNAMPWDEPIPSPKPCSQCSEGVAICITREWRWEPKMLRKVFTFTYQCETCERKEEVEELG